MINRFIDVNGIPTRCIIAGKPGAPPLLLLHTTFLTAEMWARNIDALGRDFFVVATDILGHGFTRPPSSMGKLDLGLKAHHLIQLADTLKWKEFAVGGSTLGALIAARLFFTNRDRVTKLIVNGSRFFFDTADQLAPSGQGLYNQFKDKVSGLSSEEWREIMKPSFHDPRSMPEAFLTILPLCYAQPWMSGYIHETLIELGDRDRLRPHCVVDRLEDITAKTLVVLGATDPGAVHESTIAKVKRLPQAQLITFENCAHLPMLEYPVKYNKLVGDFLQQ